MFLFSLAVFHHINEIHAFMYDLVDYNTDGSVTLHTDPIFVATNQAPGEEFPPTVIHSLSRMLLSDNSDRHFYSVWAFKFKYYLEHTKNWWHSKKIIFISYTNQPGNITKNDLQLPYCL